MLASWLVAALYDGFLSGAEEACLSGWRADLLGEVAGRGLEVGAGTGASLGHYPATVEHLTLVEPDRHMRRQLEARAATAAIPIEVVNAPAEALPLPDASVDFVAFFLVLCSVTDVGVALSEASRVLRPGGQLLFLEHVAAERGTSRWRWQRRVEPVWKRVSGNCHLTRHTEQAISDAGFAIEQITRESMRKSLPVFRPSIRGIARKPA